LNWRRKCVPVVCMMAVSSSVACAYTSHLGLLSDGDLRGRIMDGSMAEQVLDGESCGPYSYLASAFRDAIADTEFDTLIDVEVTSTTGIFVISNCLRVSGRGLRSADLPLASATDRGIDDSE